MTISTQENEDRIAKWRAERAEIAAREKDARIEAKKRLAEAEAFAAEDAADKLLRDYEFDGVGAPSDGPKAGGPRRLSLLGYCLILPLVLAAIWCFALATPLYQASANFIVLSPQADTSADVNTLFVAQDLTDRNHGAFLAQNFVQSPALHQSVHEKGFTNRSWKAALAPYGDRLMSARFPDIALSADLDRQSGMVTLSLLGHDPDKLEQIAARIIQLTSTHIDTLYSARTDARITDAELRLEDAESALEQAVLSVHNIRIEHGDLNPDARLASVYAQIETLSSQRAELETQLKELEFANGGNTFQAERIRAMIADFNNRIDLMRSPEGARQLGDLSQASLEFRRANFSVELAEERLTLARERFEDALKSATLSQQLLQEVVAISVSEAPRYPKIPQTFLLALCLGIIVYACIQISRSN